MRLPLESLVKLSGRYDPLELKLSNTGFRKLEQIAALEVFDHDDPSCGIP